MVRINALTTEEGVDDLRRRRPAPHAILLPKWCVPPIWRRPGMLARQPVSLWAMIETPRAVLNLAEIAGGAPRRWCWAPTTC